MPLCLGGLPSAPQGRTLGLSRADSRSEARAEAVGVGCRPMLGREARPPWPHPRPVAARPRGTRNCRKRYSSLTLIFQPDGV